MKLSYVNGDGCPMVVDLTTNDWAGDLCLVMQGRDTWIGFGTPVLEEVSRFDLWHVLMVHSETRFVQGPPGSQGLGLQSPTASVPPYLSSPIPRMTFLGAFAFAELGDTDPGSPLYETLVGGYQKVMCPPVIVQPPKSNLVL